MQLLTGPYFSVGAALRHFTKFGYREQYNARTVFIRLTALGAY